MMSPQIAPSLEREIGNTPLVPLRRVVPKRSGPVLVKLEDRNPGGSVKDRPAHAIIQAAERDGRLGPGRTLLDASSGNTAIAYAMLCAARGYLCEICLPGNASPGRRELLHASGVALVITDPLEGSDGAIREARRRAAADPRRYFYADQYSNPENVRAHYATTGPEIWRQTGGRITHWVAALGTSGTFTGVGRRLREWNREIRLVAVQPDSPFHGIEGVKHLASAMVPRIYQPGLADRVLTVSTEEAEEMARRLEREEGLASGASGGANVVAALRVLREAGADATVVTLIPDGGEARLAARLPRWRAAP